MGKFLIGLVTGVVLVILIAVIGGFAVASFRSRPPSVADGSTLFLRLEGDIPERPPLDISIPFLEQRTPVTVENVWAMLHHAATDSRIKAVVFEPEGAGVGWAKMQEIRSDLEQFRKSGKPLIAFLKAPGVREYYMASACSKIYMVPSDELNLKGVGFELLYFKNTLDKLGVQVDVEHAGKYKDFGDMFVRSGMSPETSEVMNGLADSIYADLVSAIARGRAKDPAAVRAIIDDGPFLATQAKATGLIDDVRYEDQVLSDLKKDLHQSELKRISEHDYAAAPDTAITSGTSRIAFVVGEGDISRGSEDSSDSSGIESTSFDKMLSRVGADSSIKGVIIRINSPGGEVVASDEMWRAMNDLKTKKPVVISMSDDAASGGYYMAMTGDPLIAYPGTITGSIGVVFGKPDLHGLYDKVGVTKAQIARGRNALSIDSDYAPLTPDERQKLKSDIDAEYEDFVTKVAAARRKQPSAIMPIAEGRVWLGEQAKANGLVDELGGLDRAMEMIRQKAKLAPAERLNLVLYPAKRSLVDILMRNSPDAGADVLARAIGLPSAPDPIRTIWRDASLRIWLRGGMLRMMPFAFTFK